MKVACGKIELRFGLGLTLREAGTQKFQMKVGLNETCYACMA